MEKFGATFDFFLMRRGYYPRGGGEVVIEVRPVRQLNSVELLDQGDITSIYGWSFVAGTLPISLTHVMANAASADLRSYHQNINIERYKESEEMAAGNCSGIM